MASASLVVRIAADINDFSRKLNQATRDVDRAASKIASVGKSLTAAITLPVGLASAALTKLAFDADQAGLRMQRSFGAGTAAATDEIKQLMSVVPETVDKLENVAVYAHDVGMGLGMAAPQANAFAEGMMRIAANVAAGKGMDYSETLDRLLRGTEGYTRGLKELGIVISQAQVTQEAYKLGLVKQGEALTPLGTTLASYALIVKNTQVFQNAATKATQYWSQQVLFLWRDLKQLGMDLGALIVPVLRVLIAAMRDLIGWFSGLPTWVKQGAIIIAVFAAAIGPAITMSAELAAGIIKMYEAFKLLTAAEMMEKIGELMTALTNPEVVVAMLALSAVVGGAAYLWNKYSDAQASAAKDLANFKLPPSIQALLGGQTSMLTGSPLQQLKKQLDDLSAAYTRAIDVGDYTEGIYERLLALQKQSYDMWNRTVDKMSEGADAVLAIYDAIEKIKNEHAVVVAMQSGNVFAASRAVQHASEYGASDKQIQVALAQAQIQNETSIRLREAALRMVNTFDAVRMAALDMGEKFRQASNSFHESLASFKVQFSGAGALAGLQAGLSGAIDSLGPFALIVQAVSAVMQGLQPFIDALFVPLQILGQIIGIMLLPVLKLLFMALKPVGIAATYIGQVFDYVAGAIARAVGNLIHGLGSVIAHIPFLGGLGHAIERAGDGLLNLANQFGDSARQLSQARQDLEHLSFNDAMNGVTALGNAASEAAQQLTNVPKGFKIALAEFRATLPVNSAPYSPAVPSSPATGTSGGTIVGGPGGTSAPSAPTQAQSIAASPVTLQLDGKTVAKAVITWMRGESQRQFGTTARWSEVVI